MLLGHSVGQYSDRIIDAPKHWHDHWGLSHCMALKLSEASQAILRKYSTLVYYQSSIAPTITLLWKLSQLPYWKISTGSVEEVDTFRNWLLSLCCSRQIWVSIT